MLNIDNKKWETTEAVEYGEYENLKLGGHRCIIRSASVYTGRDSGTESLRVQVDIDQPDEQAEFFKRQFDNNTRTDKIWPTAATKYFSLKEEHLGLLKGFITAVENSNPGFKFNMDESTLKGKKIAGVFGLEEYTRQDGTIGTATKLTQIRSIDKLDQIKIPKVKKLDGSYVDYDSYNEHKAVASAEEVFGASIVETYTPDDESFEI